MEKRSWYAVDWRKLIFISAVPVSACLAFNLYMRLFPSPELACVLNRNGEIVKAWDEDCKNLGAEGVVLRKR